MATAESTGPVVMATPSYTVRSTPAMSNRYGIYSLQLSRDFDRTMTSFFSLSSSVGCCFLSFRFVPSVLIYDTHIPLMIEIQFNSSRIPFLLKHFERSNHIGDSRRFAPFIDVHHQQTRTQQQIDCNSMQQLDLIQSNSPTPYTTPQ